MSKNVIIIIAAVFFVMMGMMGTGFFFIMKQMNAAVAQVQQGGDQAEEEVPPEEIEVKIGPLYKLDTMIVNLADHGGKRYLRITMQLELQPAEEVEASDLVEEIDMRMPQIRDSILMILPSKTYADISGTDGKLALRDQIIAQLNGLLKKGQVATIYFTEFVVQ